MSENLKYRIKQKRLSKSLGKLTNPILEEWKQAGEAFSPVFGSIQHLVPYFGFLQEYSHGVLMWLIDRYNLSSTHSACINSKNEYAFLGAKLKLVKKENTLFYHESSEPDVSESELENYVKNLFTIQISENNHLGGLASSAGRSLQITGNVYILARWIGTGENARAELKILKTQNCVYWNPPGATTEKIIYSKHFGDVSKFQLGNLEIYPVSKISGNKVELNTRNKNGVTETIFHLKEYSPTRYFYGQPGWLASFNKAYHEQQIDAYKSKEAERGFEGRTLLEFEQAAPNVNYSDGQPVMNIDGETGAEFDPVLDTFGHRKTRVTVTERPSGAGAFKAFNIPANTNEKYYLEMAKLDETGIIRTHNWSDLLLGGTIVGSGWAANVYWDMVEIKNLTTIEPLQNTICSFLNSILSVVWNETNREELKEYSFYMQSSIQRELEERKKRLE